MMRPERRWVPTHDGAGHSAPFRVNRDDFTFYGNGNGITVLGPHGFRRDYSQEELAEAHEEIVDARTGYLKYDEFLEWAIMHDYMPYLTELARSWLPRGRETGTEREQRIGRRVRR